MTSNLQAQKNSLRQVFKLIRMSAQLQKYELGLGTNLLKILEIIKPNLIGSYKPLKNQVIPPTFLNYKYAYPIHYKDDRRLKYISVNQQSKFQKSSLHKIQIPIINNARYVEPELILVPFLCFDKNKNRLGYGGGYFDATIRDYKKRNVKCKFIGIGLQMLKVQNVPCDEMDQKLDYIVTQTEIYE